VAVDRMLATFAHERAAVRFEVPNQVNPLHSRSAAARG
jgi:hypothetical protein